MLQINQLSFERRGEPLFYGLSFTFNNQRYGLVGSNGVGKSTLASLIEGSLTPTSGTVKATGTVLVFRQLAERDSSYVYEHLTDAWSYEGAYKDLVHRWLARLNPEQKVATLSGGEWMRLRLIETIVQPHSFLILDEPTNHLDNDGRESVRELVAASQALLVISHDREILRDCDVILELTTKGLSSFSGSFDEFWKSRTEARSRQEENLREAKKERDNEKRKAQAKVERREEANRRGARGAPDSGIPKILLGARKRQAQQTLGKMKKETQSDVHEAIARADDEWRRTERDPFLRLNFEAAKVAQGSFFFEASALNVAVMEPLWREPVSFLMRAGERWRIRGKNGAGKSTLIRLLADEKISFTGKLSRSEKRVSYFRQNLDEVDVSKTIFEVISQDTRFDQIHLRNELALYGFTKEKLHQPISTLSGGERLRGALAKLFLARELPQGVLLDEPTTHLDFQSLELLESALNAFPGFLAVATHDDEFAASVRLSKEIHLERKT